MNKQVLEKYVIQHIEATTDEVIFFSWHGGEPLLAGTEFFRNVVEPAKKIYSIRQEDPEWDTDQRHPD